jgi:hypothetical protein
MEPPTTAETPSEVLEYEIEGVMRMSFEATREVSCSCGRTAPAFIMSVRFIGTPPDAEPRRWVRPPPRWFVWTNGDPHRIGDGKVIEGPFVRCDECMARQLPPPLRDAPPP